MANSNSTLCEEHKTSIPLCLECGKEPSYYRLKCEKCKSKVRDEVDIERNRFHTTIKPQAKNPVGRPRRYANGAERVAAWRYRKMLESRANTANSSNIQ